MPDASWRWNAPATGVSPGSDVTLELESPLSNGTAWMVSPVSSAPVYATGRVVLCSGGLSNGSFERASVFAGPFAFQVWQSMSLKSEDVYSDGSAPAQPRFFEEVLCSMIANEHILYCCQISGNSL
jgi:hypothetical protein